MSALDQFAMSAFDPFVMSASGQFVDSAFDQFVDGAFDSFMDSAFDQFADSAFDPPLWPRALPARAVRSRSPMLCSPFGHSHLIANALLNLFDHYFDRVLITV
jgi:hypothetical protein